MIRVGLALDAVCRADGEARVAAVGAARLTLQQARTKLRNDRKAMAELQRAHELLNAFECGADPPLPPSSTPEGFVASRLAAVLAAIRDAETLPLGRSRGHAIARAKEALAPLTELAKHSTDPEHVRAVRNYAGMIEALMAKDGYLGRAIEPTQERIRQYFRSRQRRMLAACEEAVIEHGTSVGDHREEEVKRFLRELLPTRFSVDKGMVYGEHERTHAADVVIWDALNYPRIPQGNGFLFFAASVQMIFEVKSNWDSDERPDIFRKCVDTRGVITVTVVTRDENGQIVTGPERALHSPEIRTRGLEFGAVAIRGGQRLGAASIAEQFGAAGVTGVPTLLLLVEAGKVVWTPGLPRPRGDGSFSPGELELYDAGEDALLVFTALLLGLLTQRSVQIEHPFYMKEFCAAVIAQIPRMRFTFAPEKRGDERLRFDSVG